MKLDKEAQKFTWQAGLVIAIWVSVALGIGGYLFYDSPVPPNLLEDENSYAMWGLGYIIFSLFSLTWPIWVPFYLVGRVVFALYPFFEKAFN